MWAVYKVAQIKTDHVEYDPYQLLGVDRVSVMIKRLYLPYSSSSLPTMNSLFIASNHPVGPHTLLQKYLGSADLLRTK